MKMKKCISVSLFCVVAASVHADQSTYENWQRLNESEKAAMSVGILVGVRTAFQTAHTFLETTEKDDGRIAVVKILIMGLLNALKECSLEEFKSILQWKITVNKDTTDANMDIAIMDTLFEIHEEYEEIQGKQ